MKLFLKLQTKRAAGLLVFKVQRTRISDEQISTSTGVATDRDHENPSQLLLPFLPLGLRDHRVKGRRGVCGKPTVTLRILPLLLVFLAALGEAFATERLVMVAPFDNLSDIRRYVDYEVDTGAVTGNPRKQYRIDRYSHACREFLEDIIATVPGLLPVERAQFDRVMLEVTGAYRDGLVDPEKAQAIALRLGADAIVMGSILDLRHFVSDYTGYARIKETIYSATIRVRLIDLRKESGSRPAAAIGSSYRTNGAWSTTETAYFRMHNSDPYFSALKNALEKLAADGDFRNRFRPTFGPGEEPALVSVEFSVLPTNASVFLRGRAGWKYVGGSPLSKKLPIGAEVPVRIEKEGFVPWETLIAPEPELRVTHELSPAKTVAPRSTPPAVSVLDTPKE